MTRVTEEQLTAIFGGISQELNTLDDRMDTLARKLADVTTALVAADGALAERVEELELAVRLGREGSPSSRAFRPGLLSRLTRRTRTYQGPGPEGTE